MRLLGKIVNIYRKKAVPKGMSQPRGSIKAGPPSIQQKSAKKQKNVKGMSITAENTRRNSPRNSGGNQMGQLARATMSELAIKQVMSKPQTTRNSSMMQIKNKSMFSNQNLQRNASRDSILYVSDFKKRKQREQNKIENENLVRTKALLNSDLTDHFVFYRKLQIDCSPSRATSTGQSTTNERKNTNDS